MKQARFRVEPPEAQAHVTELLGRRADLEPGVGGLCAAYQVLCATFEQGRPLYLCGNGGSFCDAEHIKSELSKRFVRPRPLPADVVARLAGTALGSELARTLEQGLPVIVLGESHGLRSAFANDRDGDFVYAQELNSLAGHLPGGALLAISTSGRSRNVLAAVALGRALGLRTVGFTGLGVNPLGELAEVAWQVPGRDTPEIQENQVIFYHALCRMVEARFFPG
jgi:D-sedoheptulose 7-phosphate isomerase